MRHAVILAGGSGTRLWPLSRSNRPKQLLPFLGGPSLLRRAFDRLEGVIERSCRWICAAGEYETAVRAEVPELGTDRYIGEPFGRDTLAAVSVASALIARTDPDAGIAFFTADHLIQPVGVFQDTVRRAYEVAERTSNAFVTFGVQPTGPVTGYGYLELGDRQPDGTWPVRCFREKPGREQAEEFWRAGPERFLWNSGMFVWKADTLLNYLRRALPDVAGTVQRIAAAWHSADQDAIWSAEYAQLPKISVDYAVMEPASRDPAVKILALPLNVEWMDVGSWSSWAKCMAADESGNRVHGAAALMDCREVTVISDDPSHLIAVIGGEQWIVVHTPDATLVCPADQAESVKKLYNVIRERFGERYL